MMSDLLPCQDDSQQTLPNPDRPPRADACAPPRVLSSVTADGLSWGAKRASGVAALDVRAKMLFFLFLGVMHGSVRAACVRIAFPKLLRTRGCGVCGGGCVRASYTVQGWAQRSPWFWSGPNSSRYGRCPELNLSTKPADWSGQSSHSRMALRHT